MNLLHTNVQINSSLCSNTSTQLGLCMNDLFRNVFPNKCCELLFTSRVPVEGKSSVCLICMKYRIIFLIIIIISLGQILLSYIANTSRTQARRHAPARTRTQPPPHTPPSPYRYSMGLCQPTLTTRTAGDNSWSLAIEINTGTGGPVSPGFECFSHIKNATPN